MSDRETSLKTIASRPLRSSFSRARLIASAPCSAAKPTTVCSSVRSRATPASTSSVRSRSSLTASAPSRCIFPASTSAARKSATAAAIRSTWLRLNSVLTASASSAVVSTSILATPAGSASDTLAATTVTSAPRRAACSASAKPMRPLDRLPMKRTESIGSRVPPALTSTRIPSHGPLGAPTQRLDLGEEPLRRGQPANAVFAAGGELPLLRVDHADAALAEGRQVRLRRRVGCTSGRSWQGRPRGEPYTRGTR